MEVTLHIPDDIAKGRSASGGDVSRRTLKAIAREGCRDQTLTLFQVSEMLGLSRVQKEDFLGQHHVLLAAIDGADLDREAALFEGPSPPQPGLTYSRDESRLQHHATSVFDLDRTRTSPRTAI